MGISVVRPAVALLTTLLLVWAGCSAQPAPTEPPPVTTPTSAVIVTPTALPTVTTPLNTIPALTIAPRPTSAIRLTPLPASPLTLTPVRRPTPGSANIAAATAPPVATSATVPKPSVAPTRPSEPAGRSRASDPRLARAVQVVSDSLAVSRGLSFRDTVKPQLVTRGEMAAYIRSAIKSEEQEELAKTQELYWLLGLLRPSVELYPLYLDLLGEQVAGLFDLDTEDLLVVAGALPLDALSKITLAHELTHALQQQRFDARTLVEASEVNQDRALAMLALLEGDATLSSVVYITTNLDLTEILALGAEGASGATPVYDKAPPVIQKTLLFPYEAGLGFVTALRQGRGVWRPVNEAYGRPPVSTEQILHPARYLAGEAPKKVALPPVLPLLTGDWELLLEDVMGEFILRTYLESGVAKPAAARAASGWGGDQFRLLRDSAGGRIFVMLHQWDTGNDAQEFFDVYEGFTDSTATWAAKDAVGNSVRWDAEGRSVVLVLDQDRTLVGIAPDPETADLVATLIHK